MSDVRTQFTEPIEFVSGNLCGAWEVFRGDVLLGYWLFDVWPKGLLHHLEDEQGSYFAMRSPVLDVSVNELLCAAREVTVMNFHGVEDRLIDHHLDVKTRQVAERAVLQVMGMRPAEIQALVAVRLLRA